MTDLEHQSSGSWSEKNPSTENSFSSDENEVWKCKRPSPRTVLDMKSEESSNSGDSCSNVVSLVAKEGRKPPGRSPFHLLSSFFGKKNDKGKQEAVARCFTYQEIANATRNFDNGRNED